VNLSLTILLLAFIIGLLILKKTSGLSFDEMMFLFALQMASILLAIPSKQIINILGLELDMLVCIPIFIGLLSSLILIIRYLCMFSKLPSKWVIFVTFFLSFATSFIFVQLDHLLVLNYIHYLLVSLLGLGSVTVWFPSFILYADRSDGGSSGYRADNSRSVSSTVPVYEEKFQFGALVNGLSYSEVASIRNKVYVIMVQGSKDSSVVTVSDVLVKCPNPNTHKVLEKAYFMSKTRYDHESVIAMKAFNREGVHSVDFSPAGLALLGMR